MAELAIVAILLIAAVSFLSLIILSDRSFHQRGGPPQNLVISDGQHHFVMSSGPNGTTIYSNRQPLHQLAAPPSYEDEAQSFAPPQIRHQPHQPAPAAIAHHHPTAQRLIPIDAEYQEAPRFTRLPRNR